MTTSAPRSLRVAIVISGQLVEERVFARGTVVTLGQSLRCDLSVPIEGLPREHVLFAQDGTLSPPPGAQVVGSRTRGKLMLGDVTILFQDVATPVPAPRMQLPASLRSSLADRIDRRLAVIVAGSLLGHIGVATYAWIQDAPEPMIASYVGPQYEEVPVTIPDFVIPTAPATTNQNVGAAAPAPSQTPRPIVQPTRIRDIVQPPSAVDSQRLANILTGDHGEIGKGGMNSRQPGATLDQQIDDAKDSGAKIGDGTPTSRVDDRVHVTDNDRNLTNDPTLTQTPRPAHDEPTGRVIPGPVRPESWSTLTPATVLDRISTLYMGGLQRCYRFGLATDSTLSGRVAVSFTVDERGQVIDEEASGVSTEVDACITKQMKSWRFPIPRDKQGDATEASFSVVLALQPS